MTPQRLDRARTLLCLLQDSIRDTLIAARDAQNGSELSEIAEVTAADTIYRIDKVSEAAIVALFEAYWPADWPVELVMEGFEEGDAHTFSRDTPASRTRFKCIPYDVCIAMPLQEAGAVVEAPGGEPLKAPLDTTSPVAWMGYANPVLAGQIRPLLKRLMEEYF